MAGNIGQEVSAATLYCYVCRDNDQPFVRPCDCGGTVAVHRDCLRHMIAKTQSITCTICERPFMGVSVPARYHCQRGGKVGVLIACLVSIWMFVAGVGITGASTVLNILYLLMGIAVVLGVIVIGVHYLFLRSITYSEISVKLSDIYVENDRPEPDPYLQFYGYYADYFDELDA